MKRLFVPLALLLFAGVARAQPAFRVEVTGSGPPMVLIPGLSCGADVWHTTVEHYRKDHTLHVLTLAGFAGQPAIAAPMLERVRTELASYVREHHLGRPVIIGHSLGGFLALWLAATAPELVGAVVVVDAVPFLPALQDPAATVESTRATATQLRDLLAASTPEAFAVQNRSALAMMITRPSDVEAVARSSTRSDPRSVATALFELMTTDLRPLLPNIRVPALVFAAAGDEPASAVRAPRAAQFARLANHRLVVAEHARHFIMLDAPQLFFGELDAFLRAHKGA